MGTNRENTVVVDLSILPKRPEPSTVEKFMYGELKLDLGDVRNIQFHNVRNVVYVEMVDASTALRFHNAHHLRRVLKIDDQEYKIPVYVDDAAVNVRVHDLPPQTPNAVLKEHLQEFGTILSISREKWKHYFPGVYNGVRVVRMDLTKPIPSYQTIDGETTLITYRNQPKTCRFCGRKSHPRQKCGTSDKTPTSTIETVNNTSSALLAATDFPPLGDNKQKAKKQQLQKLRPVSVDRNTEQSQGIENNKSDVEADDSDSGSEECLTNNKRRLSTEAKARESKRKNVKHGDQENDGSETQEEEGNERESTDARLPASPAVTRSKKKQKNVKNI